MKKALVIVESPTKAKTIAKYLGKDFEVKSSFGHVRDLPGSKLGVDVEHDFAPQYVVPEKAEKAVAELQKLAAKAGDVYYATDEDREGEAIAWHLQELLGVRGERAKRITFHEITEEAIRAALANPRSIDLHLVDAQQARRILDRLVGYKLSPFLWRKVVRGLSAGRVQSVVVRLIVEREREIQAFKAQEYWTIEADLEKRGVAPSFVAKLVKRGEETFDKFAIADQQTADGLMAALAGSSWRVAGIDSKTSRRSPAAPFTTSTLQQEANNRLGYSAKQTMRLAQQLYEGVDLGAEGSTGLITYMRTDSVNLATKFIDEARAWLKENHADALPPEPRLYKTKAKGAQEAHEAIRPTSAFRAPESVAASLDERQLKLYELVWSRAVASQMTDAELLSSGVNVLALPAAASAKAGAHDTYTFRATGSTVVKRGFLAVYVTETKETLLPDLASDDALDLKEILPKQHFTEPPARYTEAALVKTLEENGIGRPSTYAPTISTVIDRNYVEKDGRKLKPTDLAFLVNDLLVAHFPNVVDYGFTAEMEKDLDAVAEGEKEWVPVVREFYGPFSKTLEEKEKEINKKDLTEEKTDEKCEKCGEPMVIKFGRFGKFLACTGYPKCKNTKPLPGEADAAAEAAATDEKCAECGAPMMVKRGRFGQFLSCSRYPECKTTKQIAKKTGVRCPTCGEGEMVERRSKKGGRTFYGCSRYPECKTALWGKPTGEKCPKCSAPLVFAKKDLIGCSNKECKYTRPTDAE
jgi:DNA topoisomerase-1